MNRNQFMRRRAAWGAIAALALTGLATAAPVTNVFPGASNVSPDWDNLASALADTDSGGTVNVAAGTYAVGATINITQPVTILGPQAGVDPKTTGGLRSAGDSLTEAVFDFSAQVTLPVVSIISDDVTINGLNFLTDNSTAQTGYVIATDNALARDNVHLLYNILNRSNNTALINGINLENTTASSVQYNRIDGFRGDGGGVNVRSSTDAVISRNQISNTGTNDPSNGIQVWNSCSNTTVTHNRLDGILGKHGILLGDSGVGGGPIYCADNEVLDFDQAAISVLNPDVVLEFNRITNGGSDSSGITRGGIYLRAANVANVVLRYNQVYNCDLPNGSNLSAGIRLQNAVTGMANTNTFVGNNLNENFSGVSNFRMGFGYDATATTGSGCTSPVDVRNCWWGNSAGPTRATTGGYNLAHTDACTSTAILATNTHEAAGSNNITTKRFRFEDWAFFAGDWEWLGTGGGLVEVFGSSSEMDNNRYFDHTVSFSSLAGDSRVVIWSPPDRHGVSNAMDVWMDPVQSFTDGVVTVQYSTDLASYPNTDDSGGDEASMQLAVWNDVVGGWEFMASTVDTGADWVQGSITSLSDTPTTFGAIPNNVALPTVTNTGGTTVYAPLSAAIVVDAGADSTSNSGGGMLDSAAVTIVSAPDGIDEVLSATPSGAITGGDISYDTATNTLTISVSAPEADYDAVLASVTYENTNGSPTLGTRSLEFQVAEASGGISRASAVSAKSVEVGAPNAVPDVTLSGASPMWIEGDGVTNIDMALTVTDADDANLESATVTITNVQDAATEVLSATPSGAIMAGDIVWASPTLTITASAPVADYEAVLRSVGYDNPTDTPTVTDRFLDFVVNDGDDPSVTETKTVQTQATNDVPTVTLGGAGSVMWDENGGPVVLDAGLVLADADHANLQSATVTLDTFPDAGIEVLAATPSGAIMAGDIVWAEPTLTITANAPIADYQAVLRSVTYDIPSDNPTATPRDANFVVNDGSDPSTGVLVNIAVSASNDDPVLDVNTGATVTRTMSVTITNAMLSASDPDHGAVQLSYSVTVAPAHDAGFPVSFTQADIDSNSITYDHDGSFAPSDSFEFIVMDPLTGATSAATFNITVDPISQVTDWTILDN